MSQSAISRQILQSFFLSSYYMYPLKARWTSFIGGVILGDEEAVRIPLARLGTVFVIYGIGFGLIFATFALSCWHAYKQCTSLGLSELEVSGTRPVQKRINNERGPHAAGETVREQDHRPDVMYEIQGVCR